MNKFYITTAIDYVNDTIHLGHIFQKLIADTLARYYRIKLGEDNVFFLTGTDEYGQKAEKAAKAAGLPTKQYVNKISKSDQQQQDSLNISYNRFITTTDEDHTKVVQEIWKRVDQNGDIYLGEFKGLYCSGCEAYYTANDLKDGKCPYHPNLDIQTIIEQNFFFKWSKYQDFLINYLEENKDFVVPESRRQEMIAFAKNGIQDIPISRTSFNWGVPIPDHPDHVVYVWFDALTNYLTGVGFLENPKLFEKFWPADVHILGKDNVRWHSLLWPAMLKSAGIELPKTILVNGFLGLNGQKISKSLGNIIRPSQWAEKYGIDGVRYYLLRYTTVTEDGDVSEEKLVNAYNGDLANGLGNLVARLAKLCEKNEVSGKQPPTEFDPKLEQPLKEYKFNEALAHLWSEIAAADKLLSDKKPWDLDKNEAQPVLEEAVEKLLHVAFNLQPFLPETAEKILNQFSPIKSGFSGKIKSQKPLFPRIT